VPRSDNSSRQGFDTPDAGATGAPAKGFSRKIKALFCFFVLALLLALVSVSLETWSRLSEKWAERRNPYIMGRTPIPETLPAAPPLVLDAFRWTPSPRPAVPPAPPRCPEAEWPQCLDQLDPIHRHLEAGHRDDMVLEFDPSGRLAEVWGCPLEKEFFLRAGRGLNGIAWKLAVSASGFNRGLSSALHGSGGIHSLSIPLVGVQFPAQFQPIPATGGAYACLPNPPSLMGKLYTLPQDTPWEVPYFRYKKGVLNPRWGLPGTCHLNNVGFRGKDVTLPKPAGTYRILCVGGSTTEEGGTDDSTYPARLEKKLAAAFPGRSIEVVNCGISGTDTAAHLMRFADYLALEPDLMIMYEGVNDAASGLPMHWLLYDTPLWMKAASFSHFFNRRFNSWFYGGKEKLREDIRTFTLGRCRIMREWALAHGVDMVFCSVAAPAYEELPAQEREYLAYRARGIAWVEAPTYLKIIRAINAGLREKSESEGWGYIPVAENFPFGLGCFGDLCHMYPEGTERKAEIIFQCIKAPLSVALLSTH